MAKDELKESIKRYAAEIFNKDENKRASAIEGLIGIGEPAVPLLIVLLENRIMLMDEKYVKFLDDALTGIGQPAVPYLIKQLKSRHKRVKMNAAIFLQNIGGPTAEAAVNEASREWLTDGDGEVRSMAADTLIKICKSDVPSLIQVIEEALQKQNEEGLLSAENIADALVEIGKPAVPVLIDVIRNTDKDPKLRLAALMILGDIGDQSALPVFKEAFKSEDRKMALTAIKAFIKLGEAGAPDLINVMRFSSDYPYSRIAEEQLLKTVGKAAVPALSKELVSTIDKDWRKKVAKLLGRIGDPGAIPALNEALNDQDKGVRKETEKALKRCEK